jgi:hypothetical protein
MHCERQEMLMVAHLEADDSYFAFQLTTTGNQYSVKVAQKLEEIEALRSSPTHSAHSPQWQQRQRMRCHSSIQHASIAQHAPCSAQRRSACFAHAVCRRPLCTVERAARGSGNTV